MLGCTVCVQYVFCVQVLAYCLASANAMSALDVPKPVIFNAHAADTSNHVLNATSYQMVYLFSVNCVWLSSYEECYKLVMLHDHDSI